MSSRQFDGWLASQEDLDLYGEEEPDAREQQDQLELAELAASSAAAEAALEKSWMKAAVEQVVVCDSEIPF